MPNERCYAVFVFIEHLVFAFWHRTGDDQGGTGIVDQDGVHLIDDSIVMSALHEVEGADGHVITQVVETELVVRTERDIAGICFPALVTVRLVLVNTVDSKTKEHIDRSIPLGVTFGEVVIDGHYVYAFVGQSVQVNRERCDECLTFTGSHLGDLTLMQYHTAEELNVIVDHIPCDFVTTCHPMVDIDRFVSFYLDKVETPVSR